MGFKIKHLPLTTLFLLMSFGAVNAVLYSPALPDIAKFFSIPASVAQETVTGFLFGYTFGQLVYGPFANRYGRKPTIYIGVFIQIFGNILCILSGHLQLFDLLILGRVLSAVGSGVGLTMTYILVNEYYEPVAARKALSYLSLAFAVIPSLGVLLGGILNASFGWVSCFYASAAYGLVLLVLAHGLPETIKNKDSQALQLRNLYTHYSNHLKSWRFLAASILMGLCTSYIYIFTAFAPLIAINNYGINSAKYGLLNLIPLLGLVIGSYTGAGITEKHAVWDIIHSAFWVLLFGTVVILLGSSLMLVAVVGNAPMWIAIFSPTILINIGICYVIVNASVIVMHNISNKAGASATMNFINLGTATIILLGTRLLHVVPLTLPLTYLFLALTMVLLFLLIKK